MAATLAAMAFASGSAHAEGTEQLGPAQIPIASGSGYVVGGSGMFIEDETVPEGVWPREYINLPGEVSVAVPSGAVVKQVLLYWMSEYFAGDTIDTGATVNGFPIDGTIIGGPTRFVHYLDYVAFRADITSLGLVGPGSNILLVEDVAGTFRTTGAGVTVIYDNGTTSNLQVKDGLDMAYHGFQPTLNAMVPVEFNFAPANVARTGELAVHLGSVGDGRPNITRITVGNDVFEYNDLYTSQDGQEWDSQVLQVPVPAGVTRIIFEVLSADGLNRPGLDPASFAVVGTALSLLPPAEPCGPCDGQISELTMRYNGNEPNALVSVRHRVGSMRGQEIEAFVVQPGGSFTVYGNTRQNTLGPEIEIFVNNGSNTRIHTSCSQDVGPGMVFGDFTILAGRSRNGGALCPGDNGGGEGEPEGEPEGEGEGEDPRTPVEDCDDGKPQVLTLRYTGESCAASDHSQSAGSVLCNGNPNGASPVRIVAVDKNRINHPQARVYFDGMVPVGGTFTVDSTVGGLTRLRANLYVFILDANNNPLQDVAFHVSCSEPLLVGDQYGSLELVGFQAQKDVEPTLVPRQTGPGDKDPVACSVNSASGTPGQRAGEFALMALLFSVLLLGARRTRQAESR
jgi:hypothetical protein